MTLPLPAPSTLPRCRRCRRVVRSVPLVQGLGPGCVEREGLVVRIDRRRPTGQDDALFNLNEGERVMITAAPEALRALADEIESRKCTGITATWCPVHGVCTCPDPFSAMAEPGCPLHDPDSAHGEGAS